MSLDRFNCRHCGALHQLNAMEMEGRKTSPWTRRCSCGARYQLTKTENRFIERPGLSPLPPPPLPPLVLPPLPPLPPLR